MYLQEGIDPNRVDGIFELHRGRITQYDLMRMLEGQEKLNIANWKAKIIYHALTTTIRFFWGSVDQAQLRGLFFVLEVAGLSDLPRRWS